MSMLELKKDEITQVIGGQAADKTLAPATSNNGGDTVGVVARWIAYSKQEIVAALNRFFGNSIMIFT